MTVKYNSKIPEISKELIALYDKSLEEIGLLVEGSAKLLTPVDTGRLRQSIKFKTRPLAKQVQIGTDTEYAVFVEKGTRYQRKQSFLEPAFIKNIPNIKRIVAEVVGRIDG